MILQNKWIKIYTYNIYVDKNKDLNRRIKK